MMNVTMPFGQHKGTPVADLPHSYCEWLLGSVEFRSPELKRAVEARAGAAIDDRGANVRRDPSAPDHERIVRTWYHALVWKHHPDRGGSHEVMAAINDANVMLLKMFAEPTATA